jgi:vancomycin resistance protein YoaR
MGPYLRKPSFLPALLVALFVVLVVGGAFGGVVYFEVHYSGRAFPGVHLQDVDLTGMTPEEIFQAAQAKSTYFRTPAISLKVANRTVSLRPADFGAGLDPAATTQRALDVGRDADLLTNLQVQLNTWWNGTQVAPVVLVDENTARATLKRLAAEVQRDPRNASFTFENGTVQEVSAQSGAALDMDLSFALVEAAVTSNKTAALILPMIDIPPQIASAAPAVDVAKRVMAQDLVIMVPKWDASDNPVAGEEAFRIRGKDLPQFVDISQKVVGQQISLTTALQREKLRPMIEKLAPAVTRDVQDARFIFDDANSQLVNIAPSAVGRGLNVDATLDAIQAALDNTDSRVVSLVVSTTQPAVNGNATAQQLGITQLITQATTYFAGSSSARMNNVKVAASRFNGLVIAPHATFSFNQYLGNVSTDDGFEEGLVIVGDRTIKGVGGGVCQVSTTAYQAALRAGYPVVERYPHGYRVGYYERGMGPGFDATVFSPYVDLKFVNDSDAYLLIETHFNQSAATLTFKFYGTPDGRQVTFAKPVISDVVVHGPDIYEPDTDNQVPAGKVTKVDYAVDGAKIVSHRTVTRNGEVLIDENLVSKYVPWQAVYRFGPGFVPPAGAEVHGGATDAKSTQ